MITPLKNVWVCVGPKGNADHWSIRYTKKDSIAELLKHTTLTWEECTNKGWRCIKVNIIFQPI